MIAVASRTQVSTFNLGHDCNSIDVTEDGSVLVTSYNTGRLRRLLLDGAGNLCDTGESLFLGAGTLNNVHVAPGGRSGVVVTYFSATIRSFTIPGLALVHTRALSGFGISGAFSPDGHQLFVRNNGAFVQAFAFDPVRGANGLLGATIG